MKNFTEHIRHRSMNRINKCIWSIIIDRFQRSTTCLIFCEQTNTLVRMFGSVFKLLRFSEWFLNIHKFFWLTKTKWIRNFLNAKNYERWIFPFNFMLKWFIRSSALHLLTRQPIKIKMHNLFKRENCLNSIFSSSINDFLLVWRSTKWYFSSMLTVH